MAAMAVGSGGVNAKQRRQRALLELVARSPIGSQEELVELLRGAGFEVTQATVSRDAAELGLVKVPRDDRHVYATPESAATGNLYDARLRRLLEDIPVRIARSGLSLVLLATPGSAGAIAQAIDQSSLQDQVGTLAGDNTLLVLFETEAALERWLVRFQTYQPAGAAALPTGRPSPADGRVAHSEAPR
jgi:transcriptional regulator of arginine metabolism